MGTAHVSLPDGMIEDVDETVETHPVIQNRSEYIRRAIHEKLAEDNDE